MNKCEKPLLWLVLIVAICYGVTACYKATTSRAQPVLRLVFGSGNCPVDGLAGLYFPSKGNNCASFSKGSEGNFYVLTRKQIDKDRKPVTHVLIANATGHIKRIVPLRRQDGRLIHSLCDFISITSSGRRWWTAYRPHESDRKENNTPKAILVVHDQSGKGLQEWVLPQAIADVQYVQAVGENRAYVADTDHHIWVYNVGEQIPREVAYSLNPGQLMTSDGEIWNALPKADGITEISVTGLDNAPRLFITLHRSPKEFYPSLFYYHSKAGLFAFTDLLGGEGASSDKAKAIYRISADGTAQKLFETPDVLQTRSGYQVRAGQPLKADDHYIWLEAEYLKNGKVMEYQIVKIPYSVR